jgi:hypothetical protein
MFYRSLILAAVLLTGAAATAAAQQPLSISIQNGRVTLQASNVTVRQILAEWSRVGGTRIVNAERIGGGPVTLELADVPEREALDILLRNVAGYVLGARQMPTPTGSLIDRVLILASSNAPAARPAGPATFNNGPATRVPRPAEQVFPEPDFDPNDPEENPPGDVSPDEPVRPRIVRPGTRPGMVREPFGQSEPEDNPQDGGVVIVGGEEPAGITAPAGSSSRPGVVTPAPDEQNQQPGSQQPD